MTKSAFWSTTKLQIGHVSATADLAPGKPSFSKYVSTFVWLPTKPAERLHRSGQIRDFSDNRYERMSALLSPASRDASYGRRIEVDSIIGKKPPYTAY
jgi:hypothetical protein